MNERMLIDILLLEINNWWIDKKKDNGEVSPDFVNIAGLLEVYLDESHIDTKSIDLNALWQRSEINKLLDIIYDPYHMGIIFELIDCINNKYSNNVPLLHNKILMIINEIENEKKEENHNEKMDC